MEQDSTINEYDEYVNEATEHCENPNERNEEFEPPVPLIKSGKPFPTYLFDDIEAIEVNCIPKDIDGFKKYIVTTTDLTWKDDMSDSSYFELSTSSKRGFGGVRKGAECKGSWVCPNGNCGFLKTSKNKQPNYVNWTYLQHNKKEKICSMCNCYAVREQCGTRKLVEYDTISHTAVVYHIGHHKCHKKLDFQMRRRNIQARTREFAQKGGTASLAGKMAVGNLIMQGKVKEAQLETHNWIDKRMTQRIFHEQQETHSVDENSFDAVGILKRALDEADEFYIYRINNGSLNGSSDYVFKTSREMALRAIRMDVNGGEDGLQKENAYFDATHTRVHGFKSFALWLIHGPMREMLRLASMEMRTENTNDISLFFTLFNEVVEKVSGIEGYKFNPQCFMCDEGGANYRPVRDVYGEEFCRDWVRGCQFHFKQQVQKRKHQIPEERREEFIQICNQLCLVSSVARYEILKGKLEEMARTTPSLWSWIEWWHIRRAHIFGPF